MSISTRKEHSGYFHSAGQRVRYRTRGDGPPLLMIHGIGAPLEFWQPLEPKLNGFRTITVDPPGSGLSSLPEGHFGMAQYAEVMDDLLTHLRLHSANVLGLSLGGMIAQELAHRSPDRIDTLVLASTAPGWTLNPARLAAFATPARLLARRLGGRSAASSGTVPADDEREDFFLLKLHWQARQTFSPSLRRYALGLRAAWTWTSRPWLSQLAMPVLAISGSDDPIVPAANGRYIASTVRNGRLEIFPGGGHLCILRESTKASRLISAFVRDS